MGVSHLLLEKHLSVQAEVKRHISPAPASLLPQSSLNSQRDRDAIKQTSRLAIELQSQRFNAIEQKVLLHDQGIASAVATAIQLLRADDEALEEKQRLLDVDTGSGRTFKTALRDEHVRLRYSRTFSQYNFPIEDASSLWWPWGGEAEIRKGLVDGERMMARAQWLRSRAKRAADPNAVALEAGAAFAEAAAGVMSHYVKQGGRSCRSKVNARDAHAARVLEDDARHLLQFATQRTNPRTVLRRAVQERKLKESLRRREFMSPAKRIKDEENARRLHARELAAERRRQRARSAAAHLALLRDTLRSKGYAGFPTTRAIAPDVKARPPSPSNPKESSFARDVGSCSARSKLH